MCRAPRSVLSTKKSSSAKISEKTFIAVSCFIYLSQENDGDGMLYFSHVTVFFKLTVDDDLFLRKLVKR